MADQVKRMRYFDGLFLKQEEFTLDQDYHIRMRRLHNRYLHSWGIVTGLEVVKDSAGPKEVIVKAGIALNNTMENGEETGQEIFLFEDKTIDLSGYTAGNVVYIHIIYKEIKADVVADRGGDEEIHWLEDPDIGHGLIKPPNTNEKIILAKVTINASGNIDAGDINGDDRTYAGFSGKTIETEKLTLGIQGVSSGLAYMEGKKFGADNGIEVNSLKTNFTGSLSITGSLTVNGNVGIGTTTPGAKLHIYKGHLNLDAGNTSETTFSMITLGDGAKGLGNSGITGWYFAARGHNFTTVAERNDLGLWFWDGTSWLSRMFIENDTGNIGIGTMSPAANLHVGASNKPAIMAQGQFGGMMSGAGGGHGVFGTNLYVDSGNQLKTAGTHTSNYGYAGVHASWGTLRFYAAGGNTVADTPVTPVTRLLIDSNGNVGIGPTTTLGEKLVVEGSIRAAGVRKMLLTRTINDITAGSYVHIGNISRTGSLPTYTRIKIWTHHGGALMFNEYEVSEVYYTGTTTWAEIPPKSVRSWANDGRKVITVDCRLSADNGMLNLRLRRTEASTQAGTINIELETNGSFTEDLTHGTGATVATGYLGQNGWFFPATANRFAATTEGLFIKPDGSVGIGTPNPGAKLHIDGGSLRLAHTTGQTPFEIISYSNAESLWLVAPTTSKLVLGTALNWDNAICLGYTPGNVGGAAGDLVIGQLNRNNPNWTHGITRFFTNGLERLRINSFGDVGIGTPLPNYKLEVNGTISIKADSASKLRVGRYNSANPQSYISAFGGATQMRLQIGDSTRMTIDTSGDVTCTGNIGTHDQSPVPRTPNWGGGVHTWDVEAEGTIWSRHGYQDGNRDYAENFESVNGKKIPAGTSIVMDGDKIRPAKQGDIPIGIISTNPGVLGGVYLDWPKKYLQDDFGSQVMEKFKEEIMAPKKKKVKKERQKVEKREITEEITRTEIILKKGKYIQKEITESVTREIEEPVFEEVDLYDKTGKKVIGKHTVPVMETYEEEIEELDEKGEPVLTGTGKFVARERPKLNPKYDEKKTYVSRSERPEWNIVGLLGQIPLKKGQPVAPAWVRIRDISDNVELWLVK